MTIPTILTIILNYRTPELTLKSAAAALREMKGLTGEIVIVDNCSGDDSFEMMSKAVAELGWDQGDQVRVVQTSRNGGFGAGNNFAMRLGLSTGVQPDFFYLLNSDASPEPGAIRRLRDFMIAYPRAGLAGSFIRGIDGQPHSTAFRFPSIAGEFESSARTGVISQWLEKSVVTLPLPQTDTQVGWVAGASLMLRRRMLEDIGPFDETFFLYFEDTDLCRRAAAAGWRTHYVPSSEVILIGSAPTGMKTWHRTPEYWFDSRLHYFTKNHGRAYAALATLARISGCLIWRIRRLIPGKPQIDPEGFLRDLTSHSARTLFQRCSGSAGFAASEKPLTGSIVEDSK
jgi:N-acetylglucosaminyl-diphospho-decaprenol L-rhamnosyltransferase